MGLIAPKTCPPLHVDPAIDAVQMDVVGFAADGTIVAREMTTISRMESMSMSYSAGDLAALRMKTAYQAATSYAVRRMYDESCPMVEKWWYRESGGDKVVDITDAVRGMRVTVEKLYKLLSHLKNNANNQEFDWMTDELR